MAEKVAIAMKIHTKNMATIQIDGQIHMNKQSCYKLYRLSGQGFKDPALIYLDGIKVGR